MLDSEHDWQVGSHQHSWLEADLSAVNRSITPWVIVTRLDKLLSKLVETADENLQLGPILTTNKKSTILALSS